MLSCKRKHQKFDPGFQNHCQNGSKMGSESDPEGVEWTSERPKSILDPILTLKPWLGQCRSPLGNQLWSILGSILEPFFINNSLKKSVSFRCCFFDGWGVICGRFLVVFSSPWKAKKQRDVGGDANGRKVKKHYKTMYFPMKNEGAHSSKRWKNKRKK